jgi:hypothetical protein
MARQPYQKELQELADAKDWFYRRVQRLFDEAYGEDLSEEQQIRFSQLVVQFNVTARRLLADAEKHIQRWQSIVEASAGAQRPTDRERARRCLEAAIKLRMLIQNTRSTISRANERDDF